MTDLEPRTRAEDDGGQDCFHAREAIARFIGAAGNRAETPPEPGAWDEAQFRAHIVRCRACMGSYRESLAGAARVGHELRAERDERVRELRRQNFQRRTVEATAGGNHHSRFGLRLALIPALFAILLLIFRAHGGEDGLVVRWSGGQVKAAGQLLSPDRPLLRLSKGDWCQTRGNALVTIGLREEPAPDGAWEAFELGIETDLLVFDPRDRMVRLERGELKAAGPARIMTAFGVLDAEEDSHVEVRVSLEGAEVTCLAGSAVWTGPRGVRRLTPGEVAHFVSG